MWKFQNYTHTNLDYMSTIEILKCLKTYKEIIRASIYRLNNYYNL